MTQLGQGDPSRRPSDKPDAAGLSQARFFEQLSDGRVRCRLCPHYCILSEGQSGRCRVRVNLKGKLELPYYGALSALAVDPIEKKPLYHFLPGSRTFSVGYLGCNLHCPFCQNYHISSSLDAPVQLLSPAQLVEAALHSGCPSLAHTYSEPLVHAEYVIETMRLARQAELKNVLVSNGCANDEAASAVLEYCDAANIDLKSWQEQWYTDELGGDLPAVRHFIELAVQLGVHLELTTLVIPGKTDNPADIAAAAAWLSGLSKKLVLHLSAYRPMYKYRIPATGRSVLLELVQVAQQYLPAVYPGNLPLGD
ncbi:MAG: AmmeMemoRadiSam system radical SAM enzyme [Spirochaetes bacterium]|nr:AmmeMemoRadiSam system radical SAM enzyme [Spirochaetota bacterium]MBU0954597.1 AmmeMemoRadiSam system radical SAM enzyme [Spirochaetota bacterium]